MSTHLPTSAHVQHVAGALQSKPAPSGRLLWRVGCTCGQFHPMWERTVGFALESYTTHFNRASR